MLHIERIREEIITLGHRAAQDRQTRRQALVLAQVWLDEAVEAGQLRAHLAPLLAAADRAATGAGALRWHGGIPCSPGKINRQRPTEDIPLTDLVLIGVDGSQIYPDRHALILYYLLQVGALIFRYDGNTPTVHAREWLRYDEADLYDDQGYLIGGETLGMERMVKEIEVLADLVEQERRSTANPVFALSDGPLLWPYVERGNRAGTHFTAYLGALGKVQKAGGIPVGYVDRPGGRPLLELLWAGRLAPEELVARIEENPLKMLSDDELMLEVLAPGAWTPWYTRATATNRRHAGDGQEIWFCYANLGTQHSPAIARIEVPAWAAGQDVAMTALQAALSHQGEALDGYPYVLARAHEEALVTTQDKTMLEQAIQRELFSAGILAQPSNKARQKLLLGRK